MPRKKRPSRKKLAADLDVKMAMSLLNGGVCVPFLLDRNMASRVWRQNREPILSAWITELPGTRPRAWWDYDSPEPRRAVQGVAFYDRHPDVFRKYCFGITPILDDDPPEYETEFDFLRRHKLLTDFEKAVSVEMMRQTSCQSWRRSDLDRLDRILAELGFIETFTSI